MLALLAARIVSKIMSGPEEVKRVAAKQDIGTLPMGVPGPFVSIGKATQNLWIPLAIRR